MNILVKQIIESLSNSAGQEFFDRIVVNMAAALGLEYVFIAVLDEQKRISKTIALSAKGQLADNFEYDLIDTPCAEVVDNSICCYPNHVTRYFPKDELLIQMNIESYIGSPLHDSNGQVIGLIVALSEQQIQDMEQVTTLFKLFSGRISVELERTYQALQIELLSTAFSNASDAILITGPTNHIIQTNPAFERLFGYTQSEVIGRSPSILTSSNNSESFHERMWHSITEAGKWSGEVVNKKSDGCDISLWVSITVIKNTDGSIKNYLAIYSDITELKRSQEKINYLAYHDTLTSLYNKSFLNELLDVPKERTLVFLDINNFNYINSAYGFDNGDSILISVAHKLKAFGADFEFNINVDEYALLFNKLVDAHKLINTIKTYFSENPIGVDDLNIYISFTYGVAFGRNDLHRKAALALKKAKEMGKNRYEIFQPNKENSDYKKREIFLDATNLLHRSIENDAIVPFFQGIHNNQTGHIDKFETLMRIIDNGKILSPYPFLEPAKLSGLLPTITRIMIDKSFAIMASRSEVFSLNITEEDLQQLYLVDYLTMRCNYYRIKPERVILEILEGVSAHGQKNHIKQLHALKDQGFKIAIDDFGAEYSNFERVLEHDINFLKIDARYIKDIDTNEKSYEITRAITFFAKNAGIPCIAEFVHSEAVQKIIKELGIEYSQGYLFSEPKNLINETSKNGRSHL